jgi:serine/threonine protein kinase
MLDEAGRPIELGRGAMGVTYKALDVDLRYPVTLKVISERISVRNRHGFVSCARRAQRPVSVTRMLPKELGIAVNKIFRTAERAQIFLKNLAHRDRFFQTDD